jgi:hypothetical protein
VLGDYWTSTSTVLSFSNAWVIGFGNGDYQRTPKLLNRHFRAVRGGRSGSTTTTTISGRFTDNGDGTVTDNMTGLIWLTNARCNYETHTQPF